MGFKEMDDLEKFMYSLHCSQTSWETLCQMCLNREKENEELRQKVKELEVEIRRWKNGFIA